MPRQLLGLLEELGIDASHAEDRGWGALINGSLVDAAVQAGFTCLLTRDRLFGESASKALKRFPRFSVVLIDIPQVRGAEFAGLFRKAWGVRSLLPVPGAMIRWPAEHFLIEE